jgi:hypothetical protein
VAVRESDALKIDTFNLFNHTAISVVDNVAKGATTSGYTLNAGGNILTIEESILEGSIVGVTPASVARGAGYTATVDAISNDIRVILYTVANPPVATDITAITDAGGFDVFEVMITYITAPK